MESMSPYQVNGNISRLKLNFLFPCSSSSYVYMIIVLKGVSGDKLAAIEMEDARGATVADLLEAARGATLPRGAFSLLFGEDTLQAFGDDALLSNLGISDGMTLTIVFGHVQDVVTCGDRTTKIWDSRTGECKLTLFRSPDGSRSCNPLAVVMADKSMVLTFSWDHKGQLWDIATGDMPAAMPRLDGIDIVNAIEGHDEPQVAE